MTETMTSVYRRVEPAHVLQVAGSAPDDVPLYLAQMDEAELAAVAELAQGLLGCVNEVLAHRRFAVLWAECNRQVPVARNHISRTDLARLWNGAAPVWPGDEPPVDGDVEATQIIPAATMAAAVAMYGPTVEPTARDIPAVLRPRPEPAALDRAEPTSDAPAADVPAAPSATPNPAPEPAAVPSGAAAEPGLTVAVSSNTGPNTVAWYPAPPADEDWTAAPPDDAADLPGSQPGESR